jgi:hypothetical protein
MAASTEKNFHTVGEVEFELVRRATPLLHWVVRTVENDYTFEAGCFPRNKSRPALLAELEYGFERARTVQEWRRRLALPEQKAAV